MKRPLPSTILLVAAAALVAMTARAAGSVVDPAHAARHVIGAVAAELPESLSLLFSREARMELIRKRCEGNFLDFVELMWPVLDQGAPFVRGKVQEAIALHLEAVHHGRIRNFLGNVPPGSTKTYLVNVFFPAWEWGPRNRPDLRYMSWSYSPKLAEKANDDCRTLIKSEVYQRFWGDRFKLDTRSDAKSFYQNDKGGWRRSSSIKGEGTGFRADRLIWDDPHNVKHADSKAELQTATRWFARTLPTRVRSLTGDIDVRVPWWVRDVHGMLEDDPNDKRPVTASATIGIMQRVHLHDVSGIILRNPALGYEILLIEMRYRGADHPARQMPTWPKSTIGYEDWRKDEGELADPIRFPEAELKKLEAQLMSEGLGTDAIAAQMEQWPTSETGILFTENWLPVIEPEDSSHGVDKRGWDFAGSEAARADETATARVRRGNNGAFYLMDSRAMRGGPKAVDDFISKYHREDPMDLEWSIPQDPGQAGKYQVAVIVRTLTVGRYVTSSRELGKEKAAKPVSSQAQAGNFFIVRHDGWEKTRSQMIEFPYGTHDDLVDAVSRAFAAHVVRPPPLEVHGGFSGDEQTRAPAAEVRRQTTRDFDF